MTHQETKDVLQEIFTINISTASNYKNSELVFENSMKIGALIMQLQSSEHLHILEEVRSKYSFQPLN